MELQVPSAPSTKVFILATIAYLIFVFVGAWWAGFFRPDWTPIDPNEWGDVLAGVFSPLAFWWLLYASLSQRTQLAIQQKEIFHTINSQLRAEEQLRQEQQIWVTWYLGCLSDLHDQLINYTGHLVRDVSPNAPLPAADEAIFQVSQLPAVLQVESGLPKIHYLPIPSRPRVMSLLASIRRVHRATFDYRYRARTLGHIDADHIQSFCQMLNDLAVDSWHIAVEGRQALADEHEGVDGA